MVGAHWLSDYGDPSMQEASDCKDRDSLRASADPLIILGIGATVLVGLVLRFATISDLWLDEALSVNIARLPFSQMFEALRHDGHPPLYYIMLHGWMNLFGDGDLAVRAMSGVISAATLPVAWFAGHRYGGRAVGLFTIALLASSPFALRYATETRMYALITFLALVGWLALQRALERKTFMRCAMVGVCAGLLLLTHYWTFYFLAALMVTLAWGAWRGRLSGDRRGALMIMVSIAGGGLLFLPWLPSFLEQVSNTGTPWGAPVRPVTMLVTTLTDFGGGLYGEAQLLGALIGIFALVALVGRGVDQNRIEIDFRTLTGSRPEWAVIVLTMSLAVVAGFATSSAFASRYTAIVFPLVILLAAKGIGLLPSLAIQRLVLVGLVLVGLGAGARTALTERTQAGNIAAAVTQAAKPGDVVAFCPDQLGPSVSRLLPKSIKAVSYPDATPPQRVDWVHYAAKIKTSDPLGFGRQLNDMAGAATVWLVWSGDYRSVEGKCEAVVQQLSELRPTMNIVVELGTLFEHGQLLAFEAS